MVVERTRSVVVPDVGTREPHIRASSPSSTNGFGRFMSELDLRCQTNGNPGVEIDNQQSLD